MSSAPHTTELGPLDPCYPITRAGSTREIHARHPREERLTLCGRSIGHNIHPPADAYIACRDCRLTATMVRDRAARGLPEICLHWTQGKWESRRTRCMQPVEGHRLRPDLSYDHPWHDGYELPPELDDTEDD